MPTIDIHTFCSPSAPRDDRFGVAEALCVARSGRNTVTNYRETTYNILSRDEYPTHSNPIAV